MKQAEILLADMMFEGLNVDTNNKIVSVTDDHEDFIDTSIANNPTETSKSIAIFKRKKSSKLDVSDGNPLVYALKGMKGWSMSEADKKLLWSKIDKIIRKVKFDIDVIIIPSSSSKLVSIFANSVKEHYSDATIISKCLLKRTVDEVIDTMDFSAFDNEEKTDILLSFARMGDIFEAKPFPKKYIDRFEETIFKHDPSFSGKDIVGKRVLVIDDVLSSGLTLSSCAKVLNDSYFPKSITNLVMFSGI